MKDFLEDLKILLYFIISFLLFYLSFNIMLFFPISNVILFLFGIFTLLKACDELDKEMDNGKYNDDEENNNDNNKS